MARPRSLEAFLQSLESRVQGHEESQNAKGKGQKAKVGSGNWDLGVGPYPPQFLNPNSQSPKPVPWIAQGQCIEHHGVGEAYLPVLEALGRLCRTAEGESLIRLLRRQAPTWLVQMPALIDDAELEALQRKLFGVTHERMLREMADLLEALTAERPLVLWVEDLQWSDVSTLDLMRYLAQRRGPARLLVVGTYRPADVIVSEHPLKAIKQELYGHGQCEELRLRFLTTAEVTQYVTARFPVEARQTASLQELGRLVHQSTDGNPLFMVTLVDYLVDQGAITEEAGQWQVRARLEDIAGGVPDSLRQLIEKQFDRLGKEERQVLEVASVAGGEFSTAAVAAGLEAQDAYTEEWCNGLARRGHFLSAQGTEPLPDGTVAGRYRFLHALYQKVLYERLPLAQRVRLHRRIGEGREAVYGNHAREVAAELAMHFERGQDYRRAVQYLGQAAQNALRRSANQEAIDLLTKGLDLLKSLPDTPERSQQELMLQATLGIPLMMMRGYTAPELKRAYDRALELCRQMGESPQLFPVLVGLSRFYTVREEFQTASEVREQLLRLAHSAHDPSLLLVAHMMVGGNLLYQGEFALARTHAEQGLTLYDPQQHRTLIFLYGEDPQTLCLCWMALALWYLGYPDQALDRIYQALETAQEIAHPSALTFALFWTALLHQVRREVERVQEQTETFLALAQELENPPYIALGTSLRGWALAQQGRTEEGIARVRQGMAGLRAIGHELGQPYFSALLAEAYSKEGRVEEEMKVLTEALETTHKTGECMHQAELYRLKGELLLAQESKEERQKAKRKRQKFQILNPKAQSLPQKPKRASSRPSRLLVSSGRSHWSYERQ